MYTKVIDFRDLYHSCTIFANFMHVFACLQKAVHAISHRVPLKTVTILSNNFIRYPTAIKPYSEKMRRLIFSDDPEWLAVLA